MSYNTAEFGPVGGVKDSNRSLRHDLLYPHPPRTVPSGIREQSLGSITLPLFLISLWLSCWQEAEVGGEHVSWSEWSVEDTSLCNY